MMHTQSKVHQYSLVIMKCLCCSWQGCFPLYSSREKHLLVQLLKLLSSDQQLPTVTPIKSKPGEGARLAALQSMALHLSTKSVPGQAFSCCLEHTSCLPHPGEIKGAQLDLSIVSQKWKSVVEVTIEVWGLRTHSPPPSLWGQMPA